MLEACLEKSMQAFGKMQWLCRALVYVEAWIKGGEIYAMRSMHCIRIKPSNFKRNRPRKERVGLGYVERRASRREVLPLLFVLRTSYKARGMRHKLKDTSTR